MWECCCTCHLSSCHTCLLSAMLVANKPQRMPSNKPFGAAPCSLSPQPSCCLAHKAAFTSMHNPSSDRVCSSWKGPGPLTSPPSLPSAILLPCTLSHFHSFTSMHIPSSDRVCSSWKGSEPSHRPPISSLSHPAALHTCTPCESFTVHTRVHKAWCCNTSTAGNRPATSVGPHPAKLCRHHQHHPLCPGLCSTGAA